MVPALMYYLIKITMVERDQWTHDKDREQEKKYCEVNDVHLAEIILLSLVIMWKVHGNDNEQDEVQQRHWQEEERRRSRKELFGEISRRRFL